MPYELRTFGGLELLSPDGGQIDTVRSQSKGAAVLVYLAACPPGDAVLREELLPLLWPELAESPARNALRITLSRLRGVLPEGSLGGKGEDRLWLDGSLVTADVRTFEGAVEEGRLRDALDLYRGPFLENFHVAGAGPFNRWVDGRRGEYRRQAYRAALSLGDRAREEGDPAAAEDAYHRALELAPLKAEAAARLIRVLAERGQRTDALRLYEAFSRRLQDELELPPSEELEGLAESIRSGPREGPASRSPDEEFASGAGTGKARRERTLRGAARRPLRIAAAVLVLALIVGGVWYANRPGASESAAAPGAERAIAVLPFDVLGESRDQDFGAGIHAGLLTRLTSVSGLDVISRTSVQRYRRSEKSLPEIARELNAGWVLEGEVHRVEDEVQVNAQLVNPRTDTHVWAESYRRDSLTARTSFEIQEELTRRIVDALEVELSPEDEQQVASVPTENTAAYELYLQARRLRSEIPGLGAVGRHERRIRLLRRSLALDSTFAEAWAGLAASYKATAWREWSPVWADSARRAARRALDLNPKLADAYSYLGDAYWVLGDREAQLEAYRTALRLQPGHPHTANNLVAFLGFRGRLAEKAKWLDTLLHTSPRSGWVVGNFVSLNSTLGREVMAEAWKDYARSHGISTRRVDFHLRLRRGQLKGARKLFAKLEGSETNETYLSRRRAALALYEGSWIRAREIYRELYGGAAPGASHPVFQSLLDDRLGLAWSLRELGQMQEAREIAVRVRKNAAEEVRRTERGYPSHLRLAVSHLILDDTARALDWLGSAVDAGYRGRETLETVPTLAPLRDHPRFRRLLSRLDSLLAEERRHVEAEGWGEPG